MKRLLILMFTATFLLFTFASPGSAESFSDLGVNHRAEREINYLKIGEIVSGTSATRFSPNKQVTRGEAAAMIGRALQYSSGNSSTNFKDVSSSYFASGYINDAYKNGILSGYPDGTFRPNKSVTRGEMALMLNRAFNLGGSNTSSSGTVLMNLGIAQGYPDGTFGLNKTLIRSDFAVFLARSINEELRTRRASVSFSKKALVNADVLNVRSGPSIKYPVVNKLETGTQVNIGYTIGKWAYISVGGSKGFVHQDYLSINSLQGSSGTKNPLSDETIIIDPGHGYPDTGASGYGIYEKDVVLDTALRLNTYIKKSPFAVVMTRDRDTKIELKDRVSKAQNANGDLFISIHANSFNGSGHGTETYYYSASQNPNVNQSKAAAKYIQNRLLEAWELNDRGVKNGDFHVIRENSMPAVLVELGFIDNKTDNDKLRSPQWRELAAKAIYLGILDYYHHYQKKDVASLYQQLGASPSEKLH